MPATRWAASFVEVDPSRAVQLVRPPRSRQAPHELAGRLLGAGLEDRRGEHGEALDGVFPERLVCEGHRRCDEWRALQHPQRLRRSVVEPGMVRPDRRGIKRGANSSLMVPLVPPKV